MPSAPALLPMASPAVIGGAGHVSGVAARHSGARCLTGVSVRGRIPNRRKAVAHVGRRRRRRHPGSGRVDGRPRGHPIPAWNAGVGRLHGDDGCPGLSVADCVPVLQGRRPPWGRRSPSGARRGLARPARPGHDRDPVVPGRTRRPVAGAQFRFVDLDRIRHRQPKRARVLCAWDRPWRLPSDEGGSGPCLRLQPCGPDASVALNAPAGNPVGLPPAVSSPTLSGKPTVGEAVRRPGPNPLP